MMSEQDIRLTISEFEDESHPWIEGNYPAVVNLFRAQIKGLRFAVGEDYNIRTGLINKVSGIKTETEIRARIKEIEDEAKQWEDNEVTIRQIRSQIKGLKLALGEPYSIAEGK